MAPKGAENSEIAYRRAMEKKTHVTFPQLKYPSLRDTGLKDSVQWLEGKAMDDGAEGLWRVHSGLYDLDSFINKHPGGADWLELTKGTDITEAYECHHFSKSVDTILTKYYVRDAKTPRNSPFTFDDNGFFRSLKRAVAKELPKIPKNVTKQSDRIIDGLFAAYLLLAAFSCYTKVSILANLSWMLASLMLAWTVVASHNYIHRRSNWRMHLFSMSMWSYRDFRVSHVLSHHLYPNTLMDLEISAFEPLVYWTPRKEKPFFSKYFAFLIELLYFPFKYLIDFFIRNLSAIFRKDYFKKHWRITDLVGFLVPLWMWVVSGATFYHVFTTWLCIIAGASLTFYKIGSNAAHHHPDIWKDGDQPSYGTETPDWGVHELEAVMDREDINRGHFTIMTFFGNHALHHLFPTLDHATLTYLYPIFIEYAQKFRANFRLTNQFDLFIGQYKCAYKTEFKIIDKKEN
ncbi:cytochrome b5-related protein-like [Cydia strobilella]|uniref:cytochrome b5-related protein-like n=1 Tax=Cydia strobilella TaxID=1100964 RepID=UPI003007D60D